MKIHASKANWKTQIILFMVSQGITLFGSAIVQMAIIWHVAVETSSGGWVTLLTLTSYIPQMIISLFAGTWADRYDRKKLIIAADSIIAITTLILAIFMRTRPAQITLPLIMIVSTIRSIGSGIQTPAVNAMVPQIVPKEHLMRFNSLNSSLQSVVQFTSPLVAGAILAVGSIVNILFLDVISAFIGISILTIIPISKHKISETKEKSAVLKDLKAGIKYSFSDRTVLKTLLIFGIFIFLSVPSSFLTALMINRTFGDNYFYLTASEMIGFAGMVLGGIALGTWGGFKERNKTLVMGLVIYSIFSIALGSTKIFWAFAVFMFFLSLSIPVVQSAVMTSLQERVPTDMQGRIFGLTNAIYTGFMPLGMAVFGPLADIFEIQNMMIISGFLIFLLATIAYFSDRSLKNRISLH